MKRYRTIFHIDMDAFFASVEVVKNPSLRGKPVIVGGDPNYRGVVSTCSYEAREFGIHSAMSLSEAKRRCPHGVFIEGHYSTYREYSRRVMDLFSSYSPLIEIVSIDEAYLDVSSIVNQFNSTLKLAQTIREQVFQETKLTCSIGIASNKLVAKVASPLAKPNGIYAVPPGAEGDFLAPLPIETIPWIGAKTQAILNKDGIRLVTDLQSKSLDALIDRYGSAGYYYFQASRGIDNRLVDSEERSPKSIAAEVTFENDVENLQALQGSLSELVLKVHGRLNKNKMRTKRVSIKMRYSDFKTITRSKTLIADYNDYHQILEEALRLFNHAYGADSTFPLRLIGVSLEQLTDGYWQPTFWEPLQK